MIEGITPEQFKVLSELRKEAKKTIEAEYVDILKDNRLSVLSIKYGEPSQQYFIIFKLNGEEYKIQIDKAEQREAMTKGHPANAIDFLCRIIANKLVKIFLEETC